MKKSLPPFLITAAALSASMAFAQSPPLPDPSDRPDRSDRPEHGDRPIRRDRPAHAPAPLPEKAVPYLGVVTRLMDAAMSAHLGFTPGLGLVIEDVVPASPAAKAGLQASDIIKQINDQLVSNPAHLSALVRHFGKDAEVSVVLLRKGREEKIAVKIGERSMAEAAPFQGGIFRGRPDAGDLNRLKRRLEDLPPSDGDRNHGPRDSQEGGEPREPRRPADILRQVGPGAAPDVQVRRDQTSTTWNTSEAKVMFKDQTGGIEVRSENGKRTLVAKNANGDTVFNGPIDTDEQRKAIPGEFRKMLEQVEARSGGSRPPGPGIEGRSEARASAGSFGPLPLNPERLRPRSGEPEVQ